MCRINACHGAKAYNPQSPPLPPEAAESRRLRHSLQAHAVTTPSAPRAVVGNRAGRSRMASHRESWFAARCRSHPFDSVKARHSSRVHRLSN